MQGVAWADHGAHPGEQHRTGEDLRHRALGRPAWPATAPAAGRRRAGRRPPGPGRARRAGRDPSGRRPAHAGHVAVDPDRAGQELGGRAHRRCARRGVGEGVEDGVPLPAAQDAQVPGAVAVEHLDVLVRTAAGPAEDAHSRSGRQRRGHRVEAEEPAAAQHQQPHRTSSSPGDGALPETRGVRSASGRYPARCPRAPVLRRASCPLPVCVLTARRRPGRSAHVRAGAG